MSGDGETKREERERERRENDSKTPLFSPSHRTPSRSTARASPAPADTDSSRNAAFFGSAFVEYAESTEKIADALASDDTAAFDGAFAGGAVRGDADCLRTRYNGRRS